MPPALSFFLKTALANLGLLWFPINFRIFFHFCKSCHLDFDGDKH